MDAFYKTKILLHINKVEIVLFGKENKLASNEFKAKTFTIQHISITGTQFRLYDMSITNRSKQILA